MRTGSHAAMHQGASMRHDMRRADTAELVDVSHHTALVQYHRVGRADHAEYSGRWRNLNAPVGENAAVHAAVRPQFDIAVGFDVAQYLTFPCQVDVLGHHTIAAHLRPGRWLPASLNPDEFLFGAVLL